MAHPGWTRRSRLDASFGPLLQPHLALGGRTGTRHPEMAHSISQSHGAIVERFGATNVVSTRPTVEMGAGGRTASVKPSRPDRLVCSTTSVHLPGARRGYVSDHAACRDAGDGDSDRPSRWGSAVGEIGPARGHASRFLRRGCLVAKALGQSGRTSGTAQVGLTSVVGAVACDPKRWLASCGRTPVTANATPPSRWNPKPNASSP